MKIFSLSIASHASLKCRWTTVQKVTQKYLAANKLYRANIPSGETEEDTKANVMQLYRERNAIVDKDGARKLAAPVRFIDAVMLLSTHAKFSAVVGGGARIAVESTLSTCSSRVSEEGDQVSTDQPAVTNELSVVPRSSPGSSGNIDIAAPFRARPMGVKREKAENAAERSAYKMAKSINRVSVAIENSTKAKLLASSVAMQFKIIKSLPFGEEERGIKLMELLSKASSMETGESNGSDESASNEGDTVTVDESSNRVKILAESHNPESWQNLESCQDFGRVT